MRKIISKVALWMIFASTIAIPQVLASSVELTADATTINVGDMATVHVRDYGVDLTVVTSVIVDFNWGDGQIGYLTCSPANADYICNSEHQYNTAGNYEITATVNEYDVSLAVVATYTDTLSISVVAPSLTVEAGADQSVYVGSPVSFSSTSTGGDGTLDWAQVEWNDGTTYDFYNALSVGDLAITPIHTYTTVGTYVVTVTATDGVIISSDTLTVTVNEVPLPNLSVSGLQYTNNNAFYYTLVNNGGPIAEGTEGVTRIYYGDTEVDYMWSWYGNHDFFVAGGSSQFISGTVTEGTDVVTVCVDNVNSVTESDETNNCMSLSLLPDLSVDITGYNSGILDYTVSNVGVGSIDATTTDGYNFVNVTNLDGTQASYEFEWTYLGDKSFLSAGDSSNFQYGLGGLDIDNVYTIQICADATGLVTEGNENNNCDTEVINGYSDLTVTSIDYEESTNILSYTIENDSEFDINDDTESANFIYVTYLDGTRTTRAFSWSVLGNRNFLLANNSSTFEFGVAGTLDPSTISSLEVCTDALSVVTESNEQNNCMSVSLLPDLAVEITGYASGVLNYTVSNVGTTNIDSETAGFNFIYITNLDGTTENTRGFAWSTSADTDFLSAGGSSDMQFGAGSLDTSKIYTIAVCSDATAVVTESNEQNNCATQIINQLPTTDGNDDDDDTDQDSTYTFAVEAGADQSINIGSTATVTAIATNLDANAVGVVANINWGDGVLSHVHGVLDATGVTLAGSHVYTANGTYTVTVEATQYDSSSLDISTVSDTLTISVSDPLSLFDLTPTGISVSSTGTLYYSLSNSGSGSLTVSQSSITKITINGTTVLTDSPELTSDGAFMVAGGTSTIGVTTLSTYGIYTVEVCVDSTNNISESKEDNNCLAAVVNYVDPSSTNGGGTDTGGSTGGTDTGGGEASTGTSSSTVVVGTTYGGGAGSTGYGNNYSSGNDQDVVVTEEEDTSDEFPFNDVNHNASYYEAIYNAWHEKIVHGRTPVTFVPADNILRGEVAKVVALTFGYSPITALNWTPYSDLNPSEDLAPYILSLTEVGLLQGYTSDGTFKSAQDMTVTEIEALLERVTGAAVDISVYSDDGVTVTRGRFMDFMSQYYSD